MANREPLKRAHAIAVALGIVGFLGGCDNVAHRTTDPATGSGKDGSGGSGSVDASTGGRGTPPGMDAGRELADAGGDASTSPDEPVVAPPETDSDAGQPGTAPPPTAVGPSWEQEIHPRLVQSCGGCHGTPVAIGDAGIDAGPTRPGFPGGEATGDAPGKFAVDDAAEAYAALLPFVFPGKPDQSNLYIKISQDTPSTGGQRMPPALRQWDDESIALLQSWISSGALEN